MKAIFLLEHVEGASGPVAFWSPMGPVGGRKLTEIIIGR